MYRLLQWFFAAPNLVVLLNKYYIDTSLVRFLDEGYTGGDGDISIDRAADHLCEI